ncbi:uncharacterized protein LOC110857234 [Folsomia candida]|uniref:C-type lectin domain-containing protein n=1 Tax=Folsomia candida TaxID=158441 RepID=A0A226DHX9_FOLCA|nr:uncharacterized protein LOC110857234 [Folsomia candida]OXA45165.1 hypothetical protein Fcan01_20293 [Folsomia candida]
MANFAQIFLIVLATGVSLTVSSKCPENGNWTLLTASKCIRLLPLALPGGPAGNLKPTALPGGPGTKQNPLPGGPGAKLNALPGGPAASLKQTADMAVSACSNSGMGPILKKLAGRRLNLTDSSTNSTLLSIQSAQEGQALVDYFKEFSKNSSNQAFFGGAWIDVKMAVTSEFINWEKGYPTSNVSNNCIVMNINGSAVGQLRDVPCQERNLVWCETPANQTLDDVVANLKQEIAELKEKPFPTGYVYMQHANQPPPSSLWPKMKWVEVTDTNSTSLNATSTENSNGNMVTTTTTTPTTSGYPGTNVNGVPTATTATPTTSGSRGMKVRKTRDAEDEDLTPAFAKGRIWKATR